MRRKRGRKIKKNMKNLWKKLRGGERRRRVITRGEGIGSFLSGVANKITPHLNANNAIKAIKFASNISNSNPTDYPRRRRRRRRIRGGLLPLGFAGGVIGKALVPALTGILLKKILKV